MASPLRTLSERQTTLVSWVDQQTRLSRILNWYPLTTFRNRLKIERSSYRCVQPPPNSSRLLTRQIKVGLVYIPHTEMQITVKCSHFECIHLAICVFTYETVAALAIEFMIKNLVEVYVFSKFSLPDSERVNLTNLSRRHSVNSVIGAFDMTSFEPVIWRHLSPRGHLLIWASVIHTCELLDPKLSLSQLGHFKVPRM